jgi:hypothetical protein
MTTRFPLFILTAALTVAGTACHSLKTKAPKDNPNVAIEVEAGFKQRWIDKRVAELTAAGTDATAAHAQAEKEFHSAYGYLRAAEPGKH